MKEGSLFKMSAALKQIRVGLVTELYSSILRDEHRDRLDRESGSGLAALCSSFLVGQL